MIFFAKDHDAVDSCFETFIKKSLPPNHPNLSSNYSHNDSPWFSIGFALIY